MIWDSTWIWTLKTWRKTFFLYRMCTAATVCHHQINKHIDREGSWMWPIFMSLVWRWPLVAVAIITAAKGEVRGGYRARQVHFWWRQAKPGHANLPFYHHSSCADCSQPVTSTGLPLKSFCKSIDRHQSPRFHCGQEVWSCFSMWPQAFVHPGYRLDLSYRASWL